MKIDDFISYEQPVNYIVDSDQYTENGKTPVLTAGQSFILGYTDEEDGIFSDLPVVIFDDFTTSVQYVDFPFKVKSSAMKILKNKEIADIKYCYYLLSWLQKMPPNHKRQWISTTSQIDVELPPIDEQEEIVKKIEAVSNVINSRNNELKLLDDLIKARFVELFGDPIINTKGLETSALKDILVLKAGDFTAASDISDEQTENNPYPCYGGNGIRGYVAEYNQEGEYSLVGRQGALSGNVQFACGKFKNTEHALLATPIVEMNNIWLNQLLLNLDLKRYQTGAAQPGLSVKNLQEIPIIMVPIDEQNRFAEFVKQTDKSKVAVQKALAETQVLFDRLMQQYFG